MLIVGLIGWQVLVTIAGIRAIVTRDRGAPRYSVVESTVLSGRTAKRGFRHRVLAEAKRGRAGEIFYWVFLVGLAAHVGVWIHAATMSPTPG